MHTLLGFVSSIAGLSFAFFFIAAPTRTGQAILAALPAGLWKHDLFLMFASVVVFFAAFALRRTYRLASSAGASTPVTHRRKPPAFLVATVLVIGVLAIVRSGFSLFDTFDWDEIERTTYLAEGNLAFVLNPFTTLNHPIATLFAAASAGLFGLEKLGLRLPTLFFAAGLIAFLSFEGSKRFRGFTLILVTIHLAANGLSLWYFHSMRGYTSMMLATLILLFLTLEQLENFTMKRAGLTALVATITLFTHGFGGIFVASLALSLIAWSYANRLNEAQPRLNGAIRTIWILSATLAIAGLLFVSHVGVLEKDGWLNPSSLTLDYKLSRLALVLGANQIWVIRSALLLTVGMALLRFREHKLKDDFLSFFVLTSLGFVSLLFLSLKVDILEGRMLLGFLLPWLLWIGESISGLENRSVRIAMGSLAIGILIVPQVKAGGTLMDGDLEHFRKHERFAAEIHEKLADTSLSCVSFSGEPRAQRYFRTYYLRHLSQVGPCTAKYHLYFSQNQFGEKFPASKDVQSMDLVSEQEFHYLYVAPAENGLAKLLSEVPPV